ncbi:type VI secretion system membrane subunit TssM [Corallococcus llansteffanensis]|uniref:Type VI secretion system membrane subunit TssM n=1 Tax=Corallococcus llansteffanensis TaxID=2316731 RepID=A0A3A8NJQ0_9BACT|nr:type VI secretion system membrane subunit TssM [Corallococcus llansteffanensis]RKH44616.1 type VI secretion system membrane subunit TssM [Corallococcus llansteffanensis]
MIAYLLFFLALLGLGGAAILKLHLPPLWVALAVAGVALLVLGGTWLVKRIRARRAARNLEGALQQQAADELKTVRPDLQPEIKAMQAEFTKAVEALKTSKLSRGGKDALAVLPWYLIVGPPGAGKSTALRNSGLKFPYLSSSKGGGVRGVGGTRNCDWWLTNEAVILDTAGRYVASEDERPEWLAFLDTLIKHRPRRPINGLIVAVSIDELLTMDPQAAGELGQGIRERLDEITSRLRMLVPVYLMVTKCDLLPGFVETFSDLPRSERGQLWGFTIPMDAQKEASTDLLLERFDELTAVLEQRAIKRIGEERQQETRERIHQFPQKFDALRKTLSEFVQPLFLENIFQDTPVFRGLYFTSATQDVRAVELVAPSAGEVFGTTNGRPQAETSAEGRSYFLWDVFTKVMFLDQKVAVRSSAEELRLRKRRLAIAGASFAATALVLCLPTLSFYKNRELAREVRDAITVVNVDRKDDISRVQDLTPLRKQLQELTQHRTEGVPVWMRFGMYKGDQLFPVAQSFYNAALRRVLLGLQYERIQQSLMLFAQNQERLDWKPSSSDYRKHFEDLKMYLLITQPRAQGEPELDEAHREWLVRKMVEHWTNVKGTTGQVDLEQTISHHAATYIRMMAEEPDRLAFPRDERVVRAARRALNRVPLATLELEQIIADASREYPDVTLEELVGAVPAIQASKRIRGAFTRNAWENVVKPRLANAFENRQSWVLDRDSAEDEKATRAQLRTDYFATYIQEWFNFLRSIRVQEPKDLDQTQELVDSLLRGKPAAYQRLFAALQHNVQLEKKPAGVKEASSPGWMQRLLGEEEEAAKSPPKLVDERSPNGDKELVPRDVESAFQPLILFATVTNKSDDGQESQTALELYQDHLAVVQDTLLAVKEKPAESRLLLDRIQVTRKAVELLIRQQQSGAVILERLLLPPLRDVHGIVYTGVANGKSKMWCEQIVTPYEQLMLDRYPFVRTSLRDAPLLEVAEYLRLDGGTIRKFHKEQLLEDVAPKGRKWEFVSPQSGANYRPEMLTFLEKSGALASTLFPTSESVDPLVRFQVRIRAGTSADNAASEISAVAFTLDGTDETYRNGPDTVWKPMSWPGQAGKLGAHIHVEHASGATGDIDEPGEWGLFRLLERVKRIEPSADGRYFTATWEIEDMKGALISIDIRPERTSNPFFGLSGNKGKLMQIFRDPGLQPPRGIARGDSDCGGNHLVAQDGPP